MRRGRLAPSRFVDRVERSRNWAGRCQWSKHVGRALSEWQGRKAAPRDWCWERDLLEMLCHSQKEEKVSDRAGR